MGRTFRSDIRVGTSNVRSPNQTFNANSTYKRLLSGEALFKGKDVVVVQVKLSDNNPTLVTRWRFLRDETNPGSNTPTGYWEVRRAVGDELAIATSSILPGYVCTCPDHLKRLAPLPLNKTNSNKFEKKWQQGIIRDCKHIWAIRYLNDEVKLIDLPKDMPLPIEKELPKSNFRVNQVGTIKSIQTIIKPNNWKGFE